MAARILRFPLPQEPIRLAMPEVHERDEYPRGMTRILLVAMTFSAAIVVVLGVAVWRLFHG